MPATDSFEKLRAAPDETKHSRFLRPMQLKFEIYYSVVCAEYLGIKNFTTQLTI